MFDHCLYFNTTALARKLDWVWADAFASFDLTSLQGFMLRAIIDRPDMLQSKLPETISVTRPTAMYVLDDLESKGLIEHRKMEADSRETATFPTPEVAKIDIVLNEASGTVTARLKRVLDGAEFINTVTEIRGMRFILT